MMPPVNRPNFIPVLTEWGKKLSCQDCGRSGAECQHYYVVPKLPGIPRHVCVDCAARYGITNEDKV